MKQPQRTLLIRGFTLLEVMIAMAISALVYMGAYGLLDSVLITEERVSEKRVQLEEVQRAFYFMQQDVEQIFPRGVQPAFGEAVLPVVYNSVEERLEFTKVGWRNPIKRARSNMQRVAYVLEGETLYRLHWNVLDGANEEQLKKSPLMEEVKNISFRFYDPSQKQWLSEWNREDDDKTVLPLAIEVVVETRVYGELTRVFKLVENRESKEEGAV
jgi:general secretion pathway protein J